MKLRYVVQRYGADVPGGAERHCREFAQRLAGRGHDVTVTTTCALHYADWANHYPAGRDEIGGVHVERFPVALRRHPERFSDLDGRVTDAPYVPRWLLDEWMRLQGPFVPDLAEHLERASQASDVVIFFTYLYYTTWAGLPAAARVAPTVLHPTAHDEAPLYHRIFDETFRVASAFAVSTPEEESLIRRRFRVRQPASVIGVGTELDAGGSGHALRARLGLDDRPYLLYVGRFDVGKAADELLAYFVAFKERRPSELALVIVGEAVVEIPEHPDIFVTGFVADAVRDDALAGALALVQPSYFESFSMTVLEAWAHGVPTLVQGRCDVLAGQVGRSGGGIPYEGFAEFEVALEMLLADRGLGAALGARGRRHAEEQYSWDAVLDRYERFLEGVAERGPTPVPGVAPTSS